MSIGRDFASNGKAGIAIQIHADMKAVRRDLDRLPRSVVRPSASAALNRTAAQIATRARRRIAAAIQVPQKVIKRRVSVARTRRRLPYNAAIYLKYRAVNAYSVGNVRGYRMGVKAGKHTFPGAWGFGPGYVSKKTGKRFSNGLILKRKGRKAYPTEAMKIKIWPQGDYIIQYLTKRLGSLVFRKRFDHEIRRRLRKRQTLAKVA